MCIRDRHHRSHSFNIIWLSYICGCVSRTPCAWVLYSFFLLFLSFLTSFLSSPYSTLPPKFCSLRDRLETLTTMCRIVSSRVSAFLHISRTVNNSKFQPGTSSVRGIEASRSDAVTATPDLSNTLQRGRLLGKQLFATEHNNWENWGYCVIISSWAQSYYRSFRKLIAYERQLHAAIAKY